LGHPDKAYFAGKGTASGKGKVASEEVSELNNERREKIRWLKNT